MIKILKMWNNYQKSTNNDKKKIKNSAENPIVIETNSMMLICGS